MSLISEHKGHLVELGCASGKYRNPYKIYQDDKGKFVEMFDSSGKSFFFDESDLDSVKNVKTKSGNKITWYVTKTGQTSDGSRNLYYVACRPDSSKILYLHAHLMNHIGKGKGKDSVDHIDRNPMNNRKHNLRITTQSEQNKNTKKRARKRKAKPLPEGITQEDLPKYVVYYKEKYAKDKYRDFFRVEKHPLQVQGIFKDKWATTKSINVDAKEKLQEAIKYLNTLVV